MSNLLFITTSSLAANPRLVKEFETLKNLHDCVVLFYKHSDWSLKLSEEIKFRNPEVQFIEIDRHKNLMQTLWAKLLHKIAISLNKIFANSFKICSYASDDKMIQLWWYAKSLSRKHIFDCVIAHNLGAFYASVRLFETKHIEIQLDIEDFFPGIALYFNKALEKQNRMAIMKQGFLRARFITYASNGIYLECKKHFKTPIETKHQTLINSFSETDFVKPFDRTCNKLKCVWFSQKVSLDRGLSQVFEAAEKLNHIEFHLIGFKSPDFAQSVTLSENVIFHDIMAQSELHSFLSTMDIGLALEPGKDFNNTIALSNKVIAYAQAGLYILATNTFGQSQFLNSLDYKAGSIIKTSLLMELKHINEALLDLPAKTMRWEKAKAFSWNNEQIKLKALLE